MRLQASAEGDGEGCVNKTFQEYIQLSRKAK